MLACVFAQKKNACLCNLTRNHCDGRPLKTSCALNAVNCKMSIVDNNDLKQNSKAGVITCKFFWLKLHVLIFASKSFYT